MWAATSRHAARHAASYQSCCRVQALRPRWLCSSSPLRQDELNTAAATGAAKHQLRLDMHTEDDMRALASLLAYQALNPGDVYLLHGEVGAGKSTFSRAFIRAAAGDDELPVPSPTFLLQNTYGEDVLGEGVPPLHHFDLYRLTGPVSTLERLDLSTCFSQGVCMVEWAERLPAQWVPPSRLDVNITVGQAPAADTSITPPSTALQEPSSASAEDSEASGKDLYTDERPRTVNLTAFGAYWQDRLQQVQQLLQGSGDTMTVVESSG